MTTQPSGRERTLENDEAAGLLQRLVDGQDDVLAGRLLCAFCRLGDGLSGDRDGVAVEFAALKQSFGQQRRAAGAVHVEGDVAAAGPEVADQGGALGDLVEIVDAEFDAGLAGEGEQMQDDVGRAAGRGGAGDAVFEGFAGEDVARLDAAAEDVHDELAGGLADVVLARVGGTDGGRAHRRESEEFKGGGHGIGGVLRSAGAGAGTGVERDLVQFVVVDGAGRVLADGLEDVLDGEVTAVVVSAGGD